MRSRIARTPAAAYAAAVLAATVSATGYSNQEAWRAAAGHWGLESFDGYLNLQQVQELPSLGLRLDLLNNGAVYPTVMDIAVTGGAAISPPNVLVNQSQPTLPGLGPIRMRPITAGVSIRAVGYWNTGQDDSTELRFYTADGVLIESHNTGTQKEVFSGIVASTPAAFVEIDTGGFGNGYITLDDLQVTLEGPPWSTYCETSPNSVGLGAQLSLLGPQVHGTTQASLQIIDAVPNQPGIFFYGFAPTDVPLGDGHLCILRGIGGIYRLAPPVMIGGNGSVARPLDFSMAPIGMGPGAIPPGMPVRFQFWYHDPASTGAGVNLSNAIQAIFYP